jgi:hypothetical protein
MKHLLMLSGILLGLGMLGASACSSCSPQPTSASTDAALAPQSYTCGKGAHRVGNQCVGDK